MTKDTALDLALKALRFARDDGYENEVSQEAITAIKQARLTPVQEPLAWMSASRFEELRKGFTVMTTLTKQRAFEDDVAIHTTPPAAKPATEESSAVAAPASWMETVTANLVREGVNKHKARELAEHFYSLAQPAPVQPSMPKKIDEVTRSDGSLKYSPNFAAGWNAAIDAMATPPAGESK